MEHAEETKFGKILYTLGAICALLAALALAYVSLTTTARLDPLNYSGQHIQFMQDGVVFNVVCVAAMMVVLRCLRLLKIGKRFLRIVCAVGLGAVALLGFIWTIQVKVYPNSDPYHICDAAKAMIAGDTARLSDPNGGLYFYFIRYPYQFGILAAVELMTRIFGESTLVAVPIFNVLLLTSGYLALLLSTNRLFRDDSVTFATLLLLIVCIQPVLACTLIYGLIPASAILMWAMYFVIRLIQDGGFVKNAIPAALLAFVATTIKPNAWIVIAAIGIVLVVAAINYKKWLPVLAAVLILACSIPGKGLAQRFYEARTEADYGGGQDMTVWMYMSMRDEWWMAPGWYNSYMFELQEKYGLDIASYNRQSREDIAVRLKEFAADPAHTAWFYGDKFTSQWNESTFQSIWSSRVCDFIGTQSRFVKSIYEGKLGAMLEWLMNQQVQLYYTGFALGVLCLLRRRKPERLLYPVVILGAVLFHLLFEAKAQYVLFYLPLFCPVAAFGILTFARKRV